MEKIKHKKVTVDGIKFKSVLETCIYKTLKENGFTPEYEKYTIILWEGFKPTVPFYDRNKHTKLLELKPSKIIDIKYTPDFYVKYKDLNVWIEAKGFENNVFYIKKKLFREYLEKQSILGVKSIYFEVYTKKDLIQAIQIIKDYDKLKEN